MSASTVSAVASQARVADRPEVWPVVHVKSEALTLQNAELVAEAGCPGLFLISMDGRDDLLDPVGRAVKSRFPALRVGVNYLSLAAPEALSRSLAEGYDATWSDAPGVRSDEVSSRAYALESVLASRQVSADGPRHLFFGSVAFKYQPPDPDPGAAAVQAVRFGMVPTTSGEATGVAPPARKLFLIRQAMDKAFGETTRAPLALASGVTPDNAYELGRFLTHILVATGISADFHTLDPHLLRRLLEQFD